MSRKHEIGVYSFVIAVKFDSRLGSYTAGAPLKFQSDVIIQSTNLVAARLLKILRWGITNPFLTFIGATV